MQDAIAIANVGISALLVIVHFCVLLFPSSMIPVFPPNASLAGPELINGVKTVWCPCDRYCTA